MDLDTDVLVIGGGMAGLAAGIRSQERGANTTLIRKGQSATSYSSGAIDVSGYLPGGSQQLLSAREGIEAITSLYPLHPYSILGFGSADNDDVPGLAIERVGQAVEWLTKHLKSTPAQLYGGIDSNLEGITLVGTKKPTALLQQTIWPGEFAVDDEGVMLFLGIKGVSDLNPKIASKTFLDNQARTGEPPHKVGNASLDIAPFGHGYNLSTTNIARWLDREENLVTFIEQVKKKAEQFGATYVALPPILGLEENLKNQKALQEATGASVFELLAFPPSVPSFRLQRGLERVFIEKGGHLLIGHEAEPCGIESSKITEVLARSPRRKVEITTRSVVLASGKYIGGGLAATVEGLRETVFGLMTVTDEFRESGKTRPQRLTNVVSLSPESHSLFGCGLSVDQFLRPVNPDGDATAENLFAAGSILAGYSYAMEKCGLGVALATGHYAGETAAANATGGGV
ncbi:MAG: anaerobic glycerol-3-phosphate dehydrogenase subunit B [Candidatus Thorarchaeota archaeon]|nr:MAG: anaerobic glycerol-3-phosphate dehydrogenase subunit B [Candidatus Thorarchaeota archaeon]